jgi:hypothetical protein
MYIWHDFKIPDKIWKIALYVLVYVGITTSLLFSLAVIATLKVYNQINWYSVIMLLLSGVVVVSSYYGIATIEKDKKVK